MTDRISIISNELQNDPLGRGYSGMTDQQAADSFNVVDRPRNNSIGAMLEYLLTKKHRSNQGGDTTYSPIIGRLYHVCRHEIGGDPFGRSPGGYPGLDCQHIHACQSFVTLFASAHLSNIDFDDLALPYGYVEAAGVWSVDHSAELQSLSQDQQTRGQELTVGYVDEQDIIQARM